MSSQLSAHAITAHTAMTRISVSRCSTLPAHRGSASAETCSTSFSADIAPLPSLIKGEPAQPISPSEPARPFHALPLAPLAAVQSSCACASPDPLDRAIQRELAALATIEADHCSACRWLDEWSGPTEVKEHLACRLEARRQAAREAHVLRLADLHQQRRVLVMPDETGEHTDEISG